MNHLRLAWLLAALLGSETWAAGQCLQAAEIFPVDTQPGAWFGYAVDVSGTRIVAGAPFLDGSSPDSGAAYLFERDSSGANAWIQERKLTGEYTQLTKAGLGVAVDGDVAAVGIPDLGYGQGIVNAHEEDLGGPGFWGFQSILPTVSPSDGFGKRLSMDGSNLLVGNAALSAFVYERSAPGVWTEKQALTSQNVKIGDGYGSAVAVNGDTALVGSNRSDECSFQSGAVYIFIRNLGGPDNWGELRILCPSDPTFEDRFGDGVALDGTTAVVSSFLEDSQAVDAGAVYVFDRDQGGVGNWGQVKKLTVPDGADDDWFGRGRGLALQGDILLVGATGHDAAGSNAGAVYIFQRDLGGPDNWGQLGKLNGFRPGQEFGASIAMDGDVTVIGAPMDDTFGPEAGAVYVFEGPWVPGGIATYCTAGTSAAGCQALLSASGAASATLPSGFVLRADQVEGARDGVFFFGSNGQQANPWGNGTSYQCVVPPVKRAGLMIGTGTPGLCNGVFTQDLNAHWTLKPNHNPGAGALVQAQLWYRDPASTSNQTTSLSEAAQFLLCP